MASIESSLKHETEVEPGKVRLIISGEFVRAYNHSAWLFYCCISKYKVIRKYSKARQENVYFLGFPVSKLLELSNGRVCEKTDFGYDITLKPEELPSEEGYEAWAKEVSVEAASRAEASALPLSGRELEGEALVYQSKLREHGNVSDDCLRFYPDILKFQTMKNRGALCEKQN